MRTAQTGNILLKFSLFFLLIAGPILSLNSISFKMFPSVAWSEVVEDMTEEEISISGSELKGLEKAEKKSQKKLREMNAPILPSAGESAEERLRRREEAKERLEYFKKDVEKKREALAGSGTPSVTSNKLEAIPPAASAATGNDPEAIQKEVKRRAALLAEKERLERELQKSETKEERKAREAREKTLRAQEEKERRLVEARKKAELVQAKAEEKQKKDAIAAQVKAQQEKLKLEEARRKAETKRLADLAEVKRNENAKKQAELERTQRAQEKKDREMADAKRKEELARQKTLEKKKQQEAVAKQKAEEERKKIEAKKSAETARQERTAKEMKAKEEARKQKVAEKARRIEDKKIRERSEAKKKEELARQKTLEKKRRQEEVAQKRAEEARKKDEAKKQEEAARQARIAKEAKVKEEAQLKQGLVEKQKKELEIKEKKAAEERRKAEEVSHKEEAKKQEALKKSRQAEEKKTTAAVSNDEARRKVVNNYLKQSQDLLDKGLYGPARVRLERVLKLDPDNVIAKNLMGLAVEGEFVAGQARLKNEQQIAREIEEDTMRQKFLDTMSRIDREIQQQTDEGNAFYQKEDLVEANIHYRRVMALQTERQMITEGLIEKLKARQTESLNDSALSAAQAKQAKTELLMKDARRLETDREWDKAAELYESVLALDPLNSEASRGIDRMKKQFLAEQKKKDNAGGKKLETDLKGKVDFYVGQAEEAKNAGELDVAKVFAEQALALDQGNRKARGILELIEKGK